MSKTRRSNAKPLIPKPPQAEPPPDPFEGKSYRVTSVLVRMAIDLYDANGKKCQPTIYTDPPFEIVEADYPEGLEALIVAKTNLKRGFVGHATKPSEA